MSEEDVVSLIVERHNSATLEVGRVWKQAGEHAPNGMTQSCVKIIENNFGMMCGTLTRALQLRAPIRNGQRVHKQIDGNYLKLLCEREAVDFEVGSWAIRQVAQSDSIWFLLVLVNENQVSVVSLNSLFDNALDCHVLAAKNVGVRNHFSQFIAELPGRL